MLRKHHVGVACEMLEDRRLLANPVASADSAVVDKFEPKNINVLANDTWDATKLPSVSIVTNPTHGTVVIEADHSITYTPSSGYAGADSLVYKVFDGANYSGNATVSLTVNQRAYLNVATTGNDANDGLTQATALLTIAAARDKVQAMRTANPTKSVSILIWPGEYRLDSRLTFTSGDSGSAAYPVTYYANGSNVVIKGSKLLTGLVWSDAPGMSGVKMTNLGTQLTQTQLNNIHSLFVNGTRAVRAKEPDVGYYTIISTDPDTTHANNRTNSFKYGDKDIDGYGDTTIGNGQDDILSTWSNLTKVEIVSYAQWHESRMRIQSVDTANKVVRIQGSIPKTSADYMGDYGMNATTGVGDGTTRYYVENVLQGLDTAGEWYLDPVAKTLYYKPLAGENINTSTFEVPVLNQLIKMFGTHDVGFDGITFAQTDWWMPAAGQPGNSATLFQDDSNTLSAVDLSGTSNISFVNSTFTNNGFYAIKNELLTTNTSIVKSTFTANGGGAIMVGLNPDLNTLENNYKLSVAAYNRIALNTSHDNNAVWRASPDIIATRSGYNWIAGNTVYNTSYHGIQAGWFDTDTAAKGHNQILRNTVHHAMQTLYDGAGIYLIGNQPSTVVKGNTIHDVMFTSKHLYRASGPLAGIYTDLTSGNMRIMGNILYDINYGFFANDSKGMTYHSNIIVDPQIAVFYMGYHDTNVNLGTDNAWQSNVISWTRTTAVPVYLLAGAVWWANATKSFVLNYNIYKYGPATINTSGNLSRIQTTNLGGATHEANALVTTNTLFANPGAKDYRIDSSAWALVEGKGFSAPWLYE